MSKLTEIKRDYEDSKEFMREHGIILRSYEQELFEKLGYLLSLLEEKDKALEEAVTILEEMVDEMAFLKSEFNVGDVLGTGLFSDADALTDRAGDIIIKRNIDRKALNTSSNNEGDI